MIRIAPGRERFEHLRFVAMRSHYGYDSSFCAPGVEGAYEKSGVESEIVLFGDFGTGKTHLLIALGTSPQNKAARFAT